MKRTKPEDFYEKYSPEPNTGCWLWLYSLVDGYGTFFLNGKSIGAHRYSYTIYKGPIPNGFLVCHDCDERSCINPDHLFLGTIQDNMDDRNKKNRQSKGEKNHSKLSEIQVIELRKLYKEGYSTRQLAAKFGIGKSASHLIATNRSWKYITSI